MSSLGINALRGVSVNGLAAQPGKVQYMNYT
jgi:hypothetical protein